MHSCVSRFRREQGRRRRRCLHRQPQERRDLRGLHGQDRGEIRSAIDLYPSGSLTIKVDLSDGVNGTFTATSIELINSYGKHNPTVYLTGRCNGDAAAAGAAVAKGLRYWLMIADNGRNSAHEGTPDVVGFAIHDRNGARVAYGTGPLKAGDFTVAPK